MGLVPTPQPGSFCLQMPIIAVPLLVPMMPPPSTVSASVTTNSPMRTRARYFCRVFLGAWNRLAASLS
eukprot:g2883.t1